MPLIAFALYAPGLGVMLLHDDAPNALWMELNRDAAFGLLSADWSFGAAGRPAANALWVVTRVLFGWYDPAILHFWNLALHGLATALVSRTAREAARAFSLHAGALPITAAAVFAFFPFSFQPVMWAGAVYHPLMAVLALGALATALNAMRSPHGQRARWAAVWVLLTLACLSHEAGFLASLPVLAAALWHGLKGGRIPAGAAGALLVALGYPLLSLTLLSRGRFNTMPASPADLLGRLTYFAQGLVYPFSALARGAFAMAPGSEAPLWIACAVGLAGIVLHALRRRWLTWPALGALWWAVFSVPQAFALPVEYIRNGPRLLYLPSIGVALVWGAVVSAALRHKRLRIVVALLFAGGLAWCAQFANERVQEARALTPALRSIVADARAAPNGADFLLLNMPWWNAPDSPTFVYGAEGLPLFQHDAPIWAWLWANGAPQRAMDAVAHTPSLAQRSGWYYVPFGAATDDAGLRPLLSRYSRVYQFLYGPPGPRVLRVVGPATPVTAPLARFADGDAVTLLTSASARQCGARILAQLSWQVVAPGPGPLAVFAHGVDAGGAVRVVADRDPAGGMWPLDQWPAGTARSEEREILLRDAAPLRTLLIGVYRRADGNRLKAADGENGAWPDEAVSVPISPCSDR